MTASFNHLREMKRRVTSSSADRSAGEKVADLEKTLSVFRAEVDMKLSIIQQILTTRNAQVAVHKKLLEREETLYDNLLEHWKSTPQLAATGISLSVADIMEDVENQSDSDFEPSGVKKSRSSLRRNRNSVKTTPKPKVNIIQTNASSAAEYVEEPMELPKTEIYEDYYDPNADGNEFGDQTEADLLSPSCLLKEGEVPEDYLEEHDGGSGFPTPTAKSKMGRKPKPGSVWNYYIREKGPTGFTGNCKACGKTVNAYGGTTSLRRHLTGYHKALLTAADLALFETDSVHELDYANLEVSDDQTFSQAESSTQSDNQQVEGSRIRKRHRPPHRNLWKRPSNKEKRMKGEAYVGFRRRISKKNEDGTVAKQAQDVIRKARAMGPPCESNSCRESKRKSCQDIPEESRLQLFSNFWENLDWAQREVYVASLVERSPVQRRTTETESRRCYTYEYYLKYNNPEEESTEIKIKVCKSMFMSTFGIGRTQIQSWATKVLPPPDPTQSTPAQQIT